MEAAEFSRDGRPSDSRPTSRGELLAALTRELIGLHKRFYGRGATKGRAIFAHRNLVLIELEDGFMPVERMMVERGETELVRGARQTFQSVLQKEFVATVEKLTGRQVEGYESITFVEADRILEIFYLEPVAVEDPDEDADGAKGSGAQRTYAPGD